MHQVLCLFCDILVGRELEVHVLDLLEHLELITGLEGCLQVVHLVDYASKGPQIGGSLADILLEELGGDVIGSADKSGLPLAGTHVFLFNVLFGLGLGDGDFGGRGLLLLYDGLLEFFVEEGGAGNFSGAEIDEFHVAVFGEHDVLGLEVSVGDPVFVEVLQDAHDLRDVENPHLVGQVLVVEPDEVCEIPPVAVLQHVVQVRRVLEAFRQLDDPRVLNAPKQLFLDEGLVLLPLFHQPSLLDLFHSEQLPVSLGEHHFPVGAPA